MVRDLTKGNPSKLLFWYALPMLGSAAFQQFYNLVDSMVAGQCIGDDALAAVGASYPITMIFVAFALGSNVGCSVIISQLFGAKKYAKMKTAVFTSLIAAVVLSIILTIVGLTACNILLELLSTPSNIFADSAVYLRIYSFGLIFVFLYNICTGAFTALGDSMTPFIFLIISSIGNIILDLVFVICFKMGVGGLAWATVVAQGIAAVFALILLLYRILKVKSQTFEIFSVHMLKNIAWLAVPSIAQQSFVSIGNLFIQSFVNGYGSTVLAGYSAAIKLNTFAVTLCTTLSNALSGFTAQNIGAGLSERVKKGFFAGAKLSLAISIPFSAVYVVFSTFVMRMFVSAGSTEVIGVGKTFLCIVAPFYIVVCMKVVCDGILRGAAAIYYFMITTFTDLILRVVLAFIFSRSFGYVGIWMAWPVGWGIACILSYTFYRSGKWQIMQKGVLNE